VLMLFDGLDEVFDPGKREDVITDIHRFTNEYPDVQVIVTSRVIGYKLEEVKNRQGIVAVDKQLLERLKELIHYSYTIPVYFFSQRDYEHNRFVKETRTQAITQIATTWKDNPQTLAWLKQRVQSDDSDDVRHAAVQELAQGWKDEPDTLPFLKQLVQSPDNFVRHAAVRELAQGWKEDPDTLPLLKQRIQSDKNWYVRRAAIQELARQWKEDPDTLPLLKQGASI